MGQQRAVHGDGQEALEARLQARQRVLHERVAAVLDDEPVGPHEQPLQQPPRFGSRS